MSKQTLIQDVQKNGKYADWATLARKHGLVSADSARKTWRNGKVPSYEQLSREIGIVPELKSVEQDNYIIDLENQIVELVKKLKEMPKASPATAFNIGHNPLDFSLELQKETILNEMRRNSPKVSPIRTGRVPAERNCLLELSIFDLHIGKLAWDKETGEDYDIEIAVARYNEAIEELLSRTNLATIDRILLPIGNDMINVDGKTNMTTSGTPQSCDSRFGKMFRTAKELLVNTINNLSSVAPVDVVVIPGNHDEVTMFSLGEVLDAWFHNDANVAVHNEPKLRKYYQYGANMIMFTHGDKEKHTDLGMIAANEQAQMWANTKYREVHLGHFHKSKVLNFLGVDEHAGFKIRILPSLSGTDAWHHGKGYISMKAAKGFIWHREKGLITEHTYNL